MNNSSNTNISCIINNKTYDIKIINDLASMETYRDAWNSMASHPHVDYDFYIMFLSSHSEASDPILFIILLDNQVKAMMVGRLEEKCIDMKFGYKTVIKPKARILNILYKGFLGESKEIYMEMFVDNIIKFLHFNNIDLVCFDHIPVDTYLYQLAIKKPSILSRDYIRKKDYHWSLTLPDTMEEFYNARTKKDRNNLKNNFNKVEKTFSVRYKIFTDKSNIEILFNDVEEIAKNTYQRGLGVGFDKSQVNENRINFMAKNGWLRAYILYLNEIPCSFAIGSLYKKTLYFHFTGYNPVMKKYEPGKLIILKMIEKLIEEKSKKVDYGFGDSFYKQDFGNINEIESSVYIFSTSIKGIMINIVRTAIVGSSVMANNLLEKINVLSKIKKYWRKKVIPKKDYNSNKLLLT